MQGLTVEPRVTAPESISRTASRSHSSTGPIHSKAGCSSFLQTIHLYTQSALGPLLAPGASGWWSDIDKASEGNVRSNRI